MVMDVEVSEVTVAAEEPDVHGAAPASPVPVTVTVVRPATEPVPG